MNEIDIIMGHLPPLISTSHDATVKCGMGKASKQSRGAFPACATFDTVWGFFWGSIDWYLPGLVFTYKKRHRKSSCFMDTSTISMAQSKQLIHQLNLVNIQKAIEAMAIEIVDLPIKPGDFPVRKLLVITRPGSSPTIVTHPTMGQLCPSFPKSH